MANVDSAEVGRCWECGYELRGLPTPRCPECGRGFDPADPKTMNMGTEVGPVRRWLMRPPGWPLHVLTGFAVLMSVWAATVPLRRGGMVDELGGLEGDDFVGLERWAANPADPLGRFLLGAFIWLLVGTIWVVRRVARGVAVKGLSKHKAATFAYWRRWLATPVIFGLTVFVCRSTLPVTAGFWISKPWLEQAARDARAAGAKGLPPRWMGVYPPTRAGRNTYLETRVDEFQLAFSGGAYLVHSAVPFDANNPGRRWPWYSQAAHVRRLSEHWYVVRFGPEDD